MTTRVCHSRGIVNRWKAKEAPASRNYRRAVRERVMIPAFAKGAHVRLVNNMKALAEWNEKSDLHQVFGPEKSDLGIICAGAAFQHAAGSVSGSAHSQARHDMAPAL